MRTKAADAIRLVQRRIRWKQGNAANHLRKRKRRGIGPKMRRRPIMNRLSSRWLRIELQLYVSILIKSRPMQPLSPTFRDRP